MDLRLTRKVAVVTGGSGGIGAAICEVLAGEGARVVVGYHTNVESAHSIARGIRDRGGEAVVAGIDVRREDSILAAYREATAHYGGIDILVNSAGAAHFAPLTEYAGDRWDEVFDINTKGVFLSTKLVVPIMRARGAGDIVNVSSLAATIGSFEGGPYAAAKAAVNSLTRSLAFELAADNIRVNCVAPGRIDTRFRRTKSGPYFDFMIEQTPQKRLGRPEEVANAVAFLASRISPFMTGETLQVAGGLHTVYLHHVVPDSGSPLA